MIDISDYISDTIKGAELMLKINELYFGVQLSIACTIIHNLLIFRKT